MAVYQETVPSQSLAKAWKTTTCPRNRDAGSDDAGLPSGPAIGIHSDATICILFSAPLSGHALTREYGRCAMENAAWSYLSREAGRRLHKAPDHNHACEPVGDSPPPSPRAWQLITKPPDSSHNWPRP